MEFPLIWLGLSSAVLVAALSRGRRAALDAWPAYVFALPLAAHITAAAKTLNSVVSVSSSLHDTALLLQQLTTTAFLALLVILFAVRHPIRGPRADRVQGLVALFGTFSLYLVVFLPVDPNASTT